MVIDFYGGYQVYSESGVDLTLLKDNLRRSPEELWEKNNLWASFLSGVRRNGEWECPTDHEPPAAFRPDIILQALLAAGAEFVLIDGSAMVMHGTAYVIQTVYLCHRRTPHNCETLAAALTPFRPRVHGRLLDERLALDGATLMASPDLTVTTELGPLHMAAGVRDVGDADTVFGRSEKRRLFGRPVRVLSLDDLIASKRDSKLVGDRLHLLELEDLKKLKDAPPEG
jgi:hypothetical protein